MHIIRWSTGYCHLPGFFVVFILPMAPSLRDLPPSIRLDKLNKIANLHISHPNSISTNSYHARPCRLGFQTFLLFHRDLSRLHVG